MGKLKYLNCTITNQPSKDINRELLCDQTLVNFFRRCNFKHMNRREIICFSVFLLFCSEAITKSFCKCQEHSTKLIQFRISHGRATPSHSSISRKQCVVMMCHCIITSSLSDSICTFSLFLVCHPAHTFLF